jgi:hypothetical protein
VLVMTARGGFIGVLPRAPSLRGKDALHFSCIKRTPRRTRTKRPKMPQIDIIFLDQIILETISTTEQSGFAIPITGGSSSGRSVIIGNDGCGIGGAFGCVGDDDGGHYEAAEFFGGAEDGSFGSSVGACECE